MQSRLRFILALLGFALVVTACSSGNTNGHATQPPTRAQLHARLLAVSEVESGWQVGEPINAADLASVTQSIPCENGAVDPAVAKRLTAVTGIQFEPVDHSYKHLIELAITGEPAQLDSDLRMLLAAMDSCATTTSTAPGTTKLTLTRLSLPRLGDQQAAYVMTGRESADSPATWYGRNAAVRVGPVAIILGLTEILGTPEDTPQISDETFVHLLQTAVGKLRA